MDKISARSQIKKYQKTTTGRTGMRVFCVVVFCMLGIPLLLSFVVRGEKTEDTIAPQEEMVRSTADSGYYVTCERATGMLQVPMEDYLISTVALVMGPEEPKEAMRALAVLLRTQVVYESERDGECFVKNFKMPEELKEEWGEQADAYMELYRSAVTDTAGIVMTWQGEIMQTAYHKVSAGNTRNGEDMLGGLFPYLEPVACEGDLMSPQYRSRITYSKADFFEKLRVLLGNADMTSAEVIIDERDEADYIVSLTVRAENAQDAQIGGETFRLALGLPSSNFTMEEDGDSVIFLCKGVGHGFGMSIYTAGLLAEEGKDFMEIIRYFYKDIAFMRIA